MQDWNQKIIEEFRANGGKVGGLFENSTLLLLTTTGAKSGKQRINPVAYLADGDRYVIFASKGGAPTHPDWYHNIVANPDVVIEVGTKKMNARAVLITGEERDRLFAKQVEHEPSFGEYQQKTTRKIPVIALIPH